MPPSKKQQKKGEPTMSVGHVVALPRAAPDVVEVAHPTSLPSFLVASSLFLLASHSRGTLEPIKKDGPKLPPGAGAELAAGSPKTPREKGKKGFSTSSGSPSTPQTVGTKRGAGKGGAADNALDVASAVQIRSAPSWKLVVHNKSIFECAGLLGDLASAVDGRKGKSAATATAAADGEGRPESALTAATCSSITSSAAYFAHKKSQEEQQQGQYGPIDLDNVQSFSAYSSAQHALVLVTEENGNQRVFVGGSNIEGQLPLPIQLEQQQDAEAVVVSRSGTPTQLMANGQQQQKFGAPSSQMSDSSEGAAANNAGSGCRATMPVASTAAVPFKEIRNIEFTITQPASASAAQQQQQAAAGVLAPVMVASARALLTHGEEARRKVAAAETALQKTATTTIKHSSGCGGGGGGGGDSNGAAGGGAYIVAAACGAAHTVILVKNPKAQLNQWGGQPSTFLFGCGRATAIGNVGAGRPEKNNFRHLAVGDGEDFDALWAFGDVTYARGRRGLVAFGTLCSGDGSSKYYSATRAQVVIPAPLGCLTREVVVLNAIGDKLRKTFVYVEEPVAAAAASQQGGGGEFDNNMGNTSSDFDGTRLLEVHGAFPSGPDGGINTMLHPPPPVFSFSDVTDKVFGSVASTLKKMGCPLFRLKRLCCGSEHAVAVTVDGAVIGFGSNHFGQLGDSAGGAERGPQFADEIGCGPRTARLYPTPDCSMVPPKLYKQYYESAVLLRPPSLRRSALVLAAAHAQHKGSRTVEFNEVVSVVAIPVADPNAASGLNAAAATAGAVDSDDDADDELDDFSGAAGSPQASPSSKAIAGRRATGIFPGGKAPTSAGGKKGASAVAVHSPKRGSSFAAATADDASTAAGSPVCGESRLSAEDDITAVLNPSWPHNTVVDCCCGPLFTALMQADAQMVLMGDNLPPVIADATKEHNVPSHAAVN